jgi:uncharacterized protein DUF4238
LRLWKYSKGKPPYPNSSPKTATRIDGFFPNPNDATTETAIEKKLAAEVEDPVHKFISKFNDSSWTMTDEHRRYMTRYINLLFNRSESRKEGTKHTQQIMARTLERFLGNEVRLITVAAQWSMKAFFRRQPLPRLLTPQDVADAASRVMRQIQTESARQKGFADLMVTAISGSLTSRADEAMINGEWRVVRTTASEPFILSDTPVVTWERLTHGFNFGIGFERPILKLFCQSHHLLVCTFCLRLRGQPHLSRQPYQRSILFKLLLHACFADRRSDEIDKLVQENISKLRIGENVFTLWHRNFDEMFYDIMMQHG